VLLLSLVMAGPLFSTLAFPLAPGKTYSFKDSLSRNIVRAILLKARHGTVRFWTYCLESSTRHYPGPLRVTPCPLPRHVFAQ